MPAIDKLVRFARAHHKTFAQFSEADVERCFLHYAATTIVRQDAQGEITGFAMYGPKEGGGTEIVAIAAIGDRWENYRAIRAGLKN